MSVRAYRLIKCADKPSFNLWFDRELMNILGEMGLLDNLDVDGVGIICISRDKWEKIKKRLKITDKKVIKRIDEDIEMGNGFVAYYCF